MKTAFKVLSRDSWGGGGVSVGQELAVAARTPQFQSQKSSDCQAWCCMVIIPALEMLGRADSSAHCAGLTSSR